MLDATPTLTRRTFSGLAAAAVSVAQRREQEQWKVLLVVAHPDDEYAFAATTYRIARELGGVVDQVVITNGEGGYRYAALAEQVYGLPLTREEVGRARLPEIRKRETLAAGRILGIRKHYFLDQKDTGYTLDATEGDSTWDKVEVGGVLRRLLDTENYEFVFTLLPTEDTHGHHQSAALLALEAAGAIPEHRRPVVLGAEPAFSHDRPRGFVELAGRPSTHTGGDVYEFSRSRPLGFRNALNYSIVANWVIAEHKSQGLFQMEASRHDIERFWRFEASGAGSKEAVAQLFERLARNITTAGHNAPAQ